jgi:glycosyltransferase involved in cell wall biosynthesis
VTTIALDARLTRQMSVGMKTYVRELVARLPAQAPQFNFLIFSNEPFEGLPANATFRQVAPNVASNGGPGEQFLFARLLEQSRPALVHYMSVYAPRRCGLAHLYTIHDLIHLRFPRYFSWKVPPYYQLVVRPVAKTAKFVITDARATVGDLQAYLGVVPSRTRVVPLAAADAFSLEEQARLAKAQAARQRFQLDRPYFVYAGNHRPHKNIRTLVEAWRMTSAACDLVLTEDGPFGFSLDSETKSNGKILTVGHVSQDELVALYAGCAGAVQPSFYEGFGLGALEAMSAGAPVIVARTPVLLELVGDAALTFVPSDSAELSRHLQTLLSDAAIVAKLRGVGRSRARDFSWDHTASMTAQIYGEAQAA